MTAKKKRPADAATLDRAGTRTTNSISHPVAGYKEDIMSNPYDGRSKHKVGDWFEVVECDQFEHSLAKIGSKVQLVDDDESECPWFSLPGGRRCALLWKRLKPIPVTAPGNPFQVGDIVRGISDRYAFTNTGMTRGVVMWTNGTQIGVRMLEHRTCCCGDAVFPVGSEHFALAERPGSSDRKIVITSDGRVTTARLIDGEQTIKTATATCSPNDKFDFNQGAGLAFGRLIVTPEWAEWYADKAKVLDELSAWLKGAGK